MRPLGQNKIFNSNWWKKLIGNRSSFSVENRLFNAVAGVTTMALFLFFVLNIVLHIPGMALDGIGCALLGVLYYFSRVKKKFTVAAIIFCFSTYAFLIGNYFANAGIAGPTVLGFMSTFILIIALGPITWHRLWITLHIVLVTALLMLEYFDIGHYAVYATKKEHFFDIAITYTVSISTLYFVILYIRNNYLREKSLAQQYAASLLKQNKELEELNHVKNRLFSIISHDLRSPLNSIQGYLELLTESSFQESEKNKIQEQLLHLTKHTQDMLFNLLSWSKSQLSGNTIDSHAVNLYNTLSGTIEIQQSAAERKGIVLKSIIDPRLLITANADMLQLVVRNLIQNAIKFTNANGEITVEAYKKDNEGVVVVKDNGIGIPLEKQAEIFSSKLKSEYGTNKEKGIGLGLYLCKEFVELQGGRIWFTSQPGKGSEFAFSLPAL